ncbi:MAG: hypothetical protein ABS882_03030, partial [Lysinibacillus sp.]
EELPTVEVHDDHEELHPELEEPGVVAVEVPATGEKPEVAPPESSEQIIAQEAVVEHYEKPHATEEIAADEVHHDEDEKKAEKEKQRSTLTYSKFG